MAALPGVLSCCVTDLATPENKSMAILGAVPVLACKNIEATIGFYQQALQFVLVNQRSDDTGIQWVHLQHAETSVMLETLPPDATPPAGCSRLYFFTDDVASLHHYLCAKGYTAGRVIDTAYGLREFNLADPEGHQLTVGQYIKR